jgi:diguanylate cyclase (GGDEF)-like protein/PAS domain S-box-containing protein
VIPIENSNLFAPAAQLMAIEVISDLLVSETPLKLCEALTDNLRELSGARTAMVIIHRPEPEPVTLLHVSPLRRAKLFLPSEIDTFCHFEASDETCIFRHGLAETHPFRAALWRAEVYSMARYRLHASGELVGTLLLFDLPEPDRMEETSRIIHRLSPPIALALKNSLAHSQIEQLAQQLEKRVEERTAELRQKNDELGRSEERFRRAVEEAPFPIMIHAQDGEVIALSRAWIEITGYALAEIPTIAAWAERAHGENCQPILDRIRTLHSAKRHKAEGEYEIHCKDGSTRIWDFSSVSLGSLPDGRRMAISMASDVTDRKAAEEKLSASEKRHRSILETAMDGFWLLSREGRILEANEAYCQMSGYSQQELLGMRVADLEAMETPEQAAIHGEKIKKQGKDRFESVHRRKDGTLVQVDVSVMTLPLGGGHSAVFLHDITERKRAEKQIQELAYFDGLTKLPNRRLMMDRLQHALISHTRSKQNGAVLFVDLDDFKTLNDTYGHSEGDLLLQKIAARLTSVVRGGDTVARLGGDEFVVILEDLCENPVEAADKVKNIGQKILAAIGRPFALSAREQQSTASIGAVLFADAPDSRDELLKLADIAMYQAKAAGRNTMCFFDPKVQAAVRARASMEEDLHQAIVRGELQLYYQPQLSRGALVGAEALIRWQHPRRGMVSPGEFIPLAEETDLILRVGAWVLQAACAQIAAWAGRPEASTLTVAVNVSARQFRQPDFVEQVLSALDRSGADPQKLRLELTETMLLDNVENVIAKMTALKSRGLSFSLDDFGTGYSSLAYLNRLPIDELKIDQSFVRNLPADTNSGAIAQTIVALGKIMGLAVIAEGVETEEQRKFLARIGCQSFQGYLFGRPVPVEEFEKLPAMAIEP